MKIILIYPDNLGAETEKKIIDWWKNCMKQKSKVWVSIALWFCDKMEVEK